MRLARQLRKRNGPAPWEQRETRSQGQGPMASFPEDRNSRVRFTV